MSIYGSKAIRRSSRCTVSALLSPSIEKRLTLSIANVTGGDGVTNVWVVNTTQDLSNSNVFFLSVISVDRTNTGFNSHYFNITNGARASQITMQSNPSQSSTTQSASMQPQAMIMTTRLASTITIMPLSSNPTSSPSIAAGVTSPAMPNSIEGDKSNNNDGLSRRAVIGLGAGLGSGALVLIATTVAFCLYRRRKNGSNQIQTSTMEDTTRYSTLQVDNFKNADLPGQRGWAPSEMTADRWRDPAEMEAKSTILEMPAH